MGPHCEGNYSPRERLDLVAFDPPVGVRVEEVELLARAVHRRRHLHAERAQPSDPDRPRPIALRCFASIDQTRLDPTPTRPDLTAKVGRYEAVNRQANPRG